MFKVVIVDDHPMVCAAVRALLEDSGQFEIIAERHNGSAGLAAVRELQPDLLIVDLDIPMLGGMEIIRRVRAFRENIAILVVSAADETANGIRSLRMGANGFVHKGGALGDLVMAAMLVTKGKSFFTQDVLANAANYPGLASGSSVEHLSEKEFEVFKRLAQGQSNLEIASHMLISNKTVSAHKRRIMERLGLGNIRDLIELAKTQNLI